MKLEIFSLALIAGLSVGAILSAHDAQKPAGPWPLILVVTLLPAVLLAFS